MSEIAINTYLRELEKLKHYGGSANEASIRAAFQNLLSTYAKAKDLVLVPEIKVQGQRGRAVIPDGTLKDSLRLDWGYWESKDEYDDLDLEIVKKFEKGYPQDNILFEDSRTAVLFQNGIEVQRAEVSNPAQFDNLLKNFVEYERPEVREFRKAIESFKEDIPKVTSALRDSIIANAETNSAYLQARDTFLELCRDVINPAITPEDIREMVIQHILTADIFNTIFDEPHFHRENNIARELEALTNTFFTREVRNKTLARVKHYYDTINAQAARIYDHHEKQRFLKVVYETFYKSYDPKKADRLGVVYTPNEIVRFMVESTDYLLQKHFGKRLEDKGVEIMDPATGTGTFICDLIDHIGRDKLKYKYQHELHANEVEILPYYIANLNIEFTYKQKMNEYCEFENLCFVDTLDNYLNLREGAELDIFSLSDENTERIKRQNERKISVIIGNPPYNANQMNENENNKNREYPAVDKRIKETYVKESKAQMTKLYDMYARFYRWAMDRLDEDGIICFISNNSYINARTFDGFRKIVNDEFQYAYIIDLGGNIRELSGKDGIFLGEKHTIFGLAAMVGISMMWLVKKKNRDFDKCRISHIHPTDIRATRDEKIEYLTTHQIKDIPFDNVIPDKDSNWINLVENDWDRLIPLADKQVKNGESQNAIFSLYSLGICSHRDDWLIDFDSEPMTKKVEFLCDLYNSEVKRWNENSQNAQSNDFVDRSIKWTGDLEKHMKRNTVLQFDKSKILKSLYRPFIKKLVYYDKVLIDRTYQFESIFPTGFDYVKNKVISFVTGERLDFATLSSDCILNLAMFSLDPIQCVSLYRFDKDGHRHDNITDWALSEFRAHYQDEGIGKENIFHYVYGVLHAPAYRAKYEINLKRSLPRLPWQEDFWRWAGWGQELMELHLGFESAEPWPLELRSREPEEGIAPKAKLKADKEAGIIFLDDHSSLHGVPSSAWDYKLGNRSALEWILDQYKEKKPKDPTIARLFNTYRFADYKDTVIDLLMRVCTVSVRTMEIIKQMEPQIRVCASPVGTGTEQG
ncbi:MAG: N-6 DNA methylase [Candidatus Syntrophosphaera sp.]|nr:N-6 DNA methylase [Candidatus Syntrophosphaera sp.]